MNDLAWCRGWRMGNVWHRVDKIIRRSDDTIREAFTMCGRYVYEPITEHAPWPEDRRCKMCDTGAR